MEPPIIAFVEAGIVEGLPRKSRLTVLHDHRAEVDGPAQPYVGTVDHVAVDPTAVLTDFDYGSLTTDPDGRPVREWIVTAIEREIEIAPGVMFPAWTYNGRVPGPAFRCVEGERLRVVFQNGGSHPHSIHFHGIHSWRMDGVPGAGVIRPARNMSMSSTPFPSAATSTIATPCR